MVVPSALRFLLGFGSTAITMMPRISDYVGFVTNFLLMTGLSFETPSVVYTAIKTGSVSASKLASWHRYTFV